MTDYQSILETEGVVVVPTPLADRLEKNDNSPMRAQMLQLFLQSIVESPEFNQPNPLDPMWKPQLGGFAAMANPSSFHHPTIRKFREMMAAAMLDLDVFPIKGRKLEQCFDRMGYRIPGEEVGGESMHRDNSPEAKDGDIIFGGWLNFEDEPQYFSCCPRTHSEVGNQNTGFAKITSEEEKAVYKLQFRLIEIPPGHAVVFYERLVHEVRKGNAKRTMVRMFLGWRITDDDKPLFGEQDTNRWIGDQAVPKIKSDQVPRVIPKAYPNFPKIRKTDTSFTNFQRLTDWSRRTYIPRCLYTHTVGSGEALGTQWIRVRPEMLSLLEYGLKLHREYEDQEVALMKPQRVWQLYTFDSPNERRDYAAPSAERWSDFVQAQHMVPLGIVVPRPRPLRAEAED
jgi:hypothetical protein